MQTTLNKDAKYGHQYGRYFLLSITLISAYLLFLINASPVFSQTGTISLFEYKQYVKPKGAPVTYTDTLQVPPGDYILWVQSGDNGFSEVKNVSVSINGIKAVGSSDLRTSNPSAKTITLQSNNTIEVVLKGQGANYIWLKIAPPPVSIAITSPIDGATFNSSPVTVTGNVSSNATVTVNGVGATLTNNTFTAAIPLNEGQNQITALAADQFGQGAVYSITVALITKGNITGTVTDSSTGLALSSATVSVTDSLNITQTVLTDTKGNYRVSNIASGTFSGSITKGGYTSYSLSGTISPGQTLTLNAALSPIPPVISNITAGSITTDSATITWTTDQSTTSLVEYGISSSYGNSATDVTSSTNHSVRLTNLASLTTYHFRITSKNSYGIASISGDKTFTTQQSPISLTINSPLNGDTINKTETIVTGTITNSTGSETGVTANGIVASMYGNEFVANHVNLTEGANTITVKATDAAGNTNTISITINAVTTGSHIKLTSNIESGIPPLTAYFSASTSNLIPVSYQLDFEGDGVIDYTGTTLENISHTYTSEGIFYPIITVTDNPGNAYSDTTAITVFSKTEMDTLLQAKWEGMKGVLMSGDVEGAVGYFEENSRDSFRQQFTALSSIFSQIVNEMGATTLVNVKGDMAEYDLRVVRNGTTYSFQLLFVRDKDGIWRIRNF